MAHQLVNSRQVTGGQRYAEYCIENVTALANLPQRPTANVCMGSVAYTPIFDVFMLTENGWVDSSGTVVSS